MTHLPVLLALALAVAACGPGPARPPGGAIDGRVAEATARLEASDAGRRVLAAIDAHGGLRAWYANGPLRYRYAYVRLDSTGAPAGDPLDTRQLVDPWSARAVHTLAADSSVSFGWTGTQAWARPAGAELPTDGRFWALTPYYFVSIPFVFADPGVRLALAPADTVEGRPVDVVHVAFEAGTGDAPDDYYDLLLDPATDRVVGVRYVVSYGPFNPEGGHTPETLMLYDGAQTVGGATVQEGFRSFATATGQPKARGTVTELAAAPETPDAAFGRPPDAEVLPGL
ncbi:hypothetical protein [Rubrivirga sp. IMCC43871]|uniref:hypothetical protein n=1 Tax=Rubrivirga sp. IMCC43871 TaxID=3391575 RepID=UPI00398FC2C5